VRYLTVLLTGFGLLVSVSAFSQPANQTIKYDLRVLGMNIGKFTVTQQTRGDEISIEAVTDVKVKIIFTYKVKFLQHTLYKDGMLANSHVETIKNGKVNSDTRLTKEGSAYILVKDGDSTLIHDQITYSGSLLYFNEPEQVPSIYKEISGDKSSINPAGDHTYVVTDEKGRVTNKYEYKNGMLDQAELKHTLATIYMKLSP